MSILALATPFVRSDIFLFERVQCVDVDVGVFALRSHSVDCTTGNKALLAKLLVGGRLVTRATITHRVMISPGSLPPKVSGLSASPLAAWPPRYSWPPNR